MVSCRGRACFFNRRVEQDFCLLLTPAPLIKAPGLESWFCSSFLLMGPQVCNSHASVSCLVYGHSRGRLKLRFHFLASAWSSLSCWDIWRVNRVSLSLSQINAFFKE